VKPTVLLAATTRWVPTARLAMALADTGFAVEIVCPSGHPLSNTRVARQTHRYQGLAPLRCFSAAIGASRPDLIVPADDLATRHLHRLHQHENSRGKSGKTVCALIERSLGATESFPVVFARKTFLDLARKQGIRSPKTVVVNRPDDLKQWANDTGFPAVLKADGTSGGNGVRIVYGLDEAQRAFRALAAPPLLARALKHALLDRDSTLLAPALLRHRSVVNAQAFVPGREATSAIACWKGVVLASLHFEVIHKAQAMGHATVVRMLENREMAVAAERIARRLCLSGLHGLDFMLDEDGRAHLIEINPRSTQIGHLTLGSGRDLPAALYGAVSGKPIQPSPRMTDSDTITLFPQEWIRDPASPYLRSDYQDVPWQEPELVRACVLNRRKQSAWYSKRVVDSNSDATVVASAVDGRVLCAVPADLASTREPS